MTNLQTSIPDGIAHDIMPRVHAAADQAEALIQRGVNAVADGTHSLQHSGQHVQDFTLNYIRREPLKSVLMAAAAGAAVMGLVNLMRRS